MADDLIYKAESLASETVGLGASTAVRYANAVVPSAGMVLKRIDMYIGGRPTEGTQTLTIRLLNDAGDTPGSLIATLNTLNIQESDPVAWTTVYTSETGRSLTGATKYWIELRIAGGGINTDKYLDDPIISNVAYVNNYARDAAFATLTGSWTDVGPATGFFYPPFRIYGIEAFLQAHDPSPADAATGVNWDLSGVDNDGYISWENDSEPDSYDIYFGTDAGDMTLVETGYTGSGATTGKWLSPYVELVVTDTKGNSYLPNGYRPPVAGDVLTNLSTGAVYYVYRVVRKRLVNVSYEFALYAFRVGEVSSDDEVLTNGVTPDPDAPGAVYVVVTDRFLSGEDAELAYFPHSEVTYYWAIDSVFGEDTVVGDTWSFTTKALKTAWPGIALPDIGLPGWTGLPPWGFPTSGIEGVDWAVPNANIVVAAANNALWYEDKI